MDEDVDKIMERVFGRCNSEELSGDEGTSDDETSDEDNDSRVDIITDQEINHDGSSDLEI